MKMKKVICIVMCLALLTALCSALIGCSDAPRDEVLKLYMPEGYIDEDIFEEFESYYLEKTGKNISVVIETFETVENVQLAIEGSKADYDVLCPSDYMVEYLISKDLLQKIDKTKVDIAAEGMFKSEYIETTKEFDPTLEYSVPYMYGTLGLVYDYSKTGKHIDSLSAIFGSEYVGRRSVKKSIHEAYVAACLYNARTQTEVLTGAAKKQKIQSIFDDTTDETIAAAKDLLISVKNAGAEWDIDNTKYEMAAGTSNVVVGIMYSCDAGYVMNDYEDEEGNEYPGNRNLWYVVPKEGGNVYLDTMVINKYAGNTEAANYFLQFICQKEIAVKNCIAAGAISPLTEAYNYMYDYFTEEGGVLDGADEDWKDMFVEAMFPSTETLERCGVMKDFGDRKSALNVMWKSIK